MLLNRRNHLSTISANEITTITKGWERSNSEGKGNIQWCWTKQNGARCGPTTSASLGMGTCSPEQDWGARVPPPIPHSCPGCTSILECWETGHSWWPETRGGTHWQPAIGVSGTLKSTLKDANQNPRWCGPSSLLLSQLRLRMWHLETVAWVRHTNGQGASNPGAPCSPFSPLGPFLPFFPFSPCGYKGLNKTGFILGGRGEVTVIQKMV